MCLPQILRQPEPASRHAGEGRRRTLCPAGPFGKIRMRICVNDRLRANSGSKSLRRPAMPLQHLQHFLIQTEDLEKTKDWYVDVLGMRVGPHPDFKFPVYWLYLGDNDVLHVTQGGANVSENRVKYLGQESTATVGSGVVDHVAFRATGLIDLIEHLKVKGIDFKERRVNNQGLYQLFLIDPNGVKIELNFEAAEASGREPELMATALQS